MRQMSLKLYKEKKYYRNQAIKKIIVCIKEN